LGSAVAITLACLLFVPRAQASSPLCPTCPDFVTTFDPDGLGGQAPKTQLHKIANSETWYWIDLDDTRLPTVTNALPPVLPYDIGVRVEGLFAVPRITIQRSLEATPARQLPLRVEAVRYESPVWKSFGYDTLATSDTPASSAPGSFSATIDTSDRDGDPKTTQAFADVAITEPPTQAGKPLAIVSETFGGVPAGTRTNRKVSRLEFVGNGRELRIPAQLTADITSPSEVPEAPQRQRVKLTRDPASPTHLTVEVSSPRAGPLQRATRTIATLEQMPEWLDITLTDIANGDGTKTQKVDYGAAAVVDEAVVTTTRFADPSAPFQGDQTTRATVEGVPTDAHLTYANPSGATRITYNANGRARRAELFTDDSKRQFTAELSNLPSRIDELTYTPRPAGGGLVYEADARASSATVRTREGTSELDVFITARPGDGPAVPAHIERLDYSSVNGGFALDYDAGESIPRAEVRVERVLDDDLVEDPEDPPPPHRREITTTVEDFPNSVHIDLDAGAKKLVYGGSKRASLAHVVVTDEQPLFEHATELDLLVEDLAPGLDATLASDRLELCARNVTPGSPCSNSVGKIELLATNMPAAERPTLPAGADGVLLRDKNLPGEVWGSGQPDEDYILQGRVRGLRHALYRPGEGTVQLQFDARPPTGTDLVVDSVREVRDTVWTNPGNPAQLIKRFGTETLKASVHDYPAGIELAMDTGDGEIHFDYSAETTAGLMDYLRTTAYRGDPVPVSYRLQYAADRVAGSYPPGDFSKHQTASFDAMPKTFHACYVAEGSECSDDTWQRDMFEGFDPATEADSGSLRLTATGSRPQFTYNDRAIVPTQFGYSRYRDEVEAAGDECEDPWVVSEGSPPTLVHICRYRESKPGAAIKKIDLRLGDVVVQSHLERAGWVGRYIGGLFAGAKAKKQGYVAIDTAFRNAQTLTGAPLCQALGRPFTDCGPNGPLFAKIGVYPPPEEESINGGITKSGFLCVASENCEELEARFPASPDNSLSFGAKIDAVALGFGDLFGAKYRVFEFDPDELIFAKHRHGVSYCTLPSADPGGTKLSVGASAFTGNFCDIPLQPESGG
jgi:hypothetical protein